MGFPAGASIRQSRDIAPALDVTGFDPGGRRKIFGAQKIRQVVRANESGNSAVLAGNGSYTCVSVCIHSALPRGLCRVIDWATFTVICFGIRVNARGPMQPRRMARRLLC